MEVERCWGLWGRSGLDGDQSGGSRTRASSRALFSSTEGTHCTGERPIHHLDRSCPSLAILSRVHAFDSEQFSLARRDAGATEAQEVILTPAQADGKARLGGRKEPGKPQSRHLLGHTGLSQKPQHKVAPHSHPTVPGCQLASMHISQGSPAAPVSPTHAEPEGLQVGARGQESGRSF